ncbi:MAG: hypothetical protein ACE5EX_01895 [Phycisphaerae bacterium]
MVRRIALPVARREPRPPGASPSLCTAGAGVADNNDVMDDAKLIWVRRVILFVIAWLVVLYVVGMLREAGWLLGAGTVAVAVAVNLFARKRMAECVVPNRAFYFWLYMPVVVLFGIPGVYKIITLIRSEQATTWWQRCYTMTPFLLKLGVPVGALLWVYVAVGKVKGGERRSDGGKKRRSDEATEVRRE